MVNAQKQFLNIRLLIFFFASYTWMACGSSTPLDLLFSHDEESMKEHFTHTQTRHMHNFTWQENASFFCIVSQTVHFGREALRLHFTLPHYLGLKKPPFKVMTVSFTETQCFIDSVNFSQTRSEHAKSTRVSAASTTLTEDPSQSPSVEERTIQPPAHAQLWPGYYTMKKGITSLNIKAKIEKRGIHNVWHMDLPPGENDELWCIQIYWPYDNFESLALSIVSFSQNQQDPKPWSGTYCQKHERGRGVIYTPNLTKNLTLLERPSWRIRCFAWEAPKEPSLRFSILSANRAILCAIETHSLLTISYSSPDTKEIHQLEEFKIFYKPPLFSVYSTQDRENPLISYTQNTDIPALITYDCTTDAESYTLLVTLPMNTSNTLEALLLTWTKNNVTAIQCRHQTYTTDQVLRDEALPTILLRKEEPSQAAQLILKKSLTTTQPRPTRRALLYGATYTERLTKLLAHERVLEEVVHNFFWDTLRGPEQQPAIIKFTLLNVHGGLDAITKKAPMMRVSVFQYDDVNDVCGWGPIDVRLSLTRRLCATHPPSTMGSTLCLCTQASVQLTLDHTPDEPHDHTQTNIDSYHIPERVSPYIIYDFESKNCDQKASNKLSVTLPKKLNDSRVFETSWTTENFSELTFSFTKNTSDARPSPAQKIPPLQCTRATRTPHCGVRYGQDFKQHFRMLESDATFKYFVWDRMETQGFKILFTLLAETDGLLRTTNNHNFFQMSILYRDAQSLIHRAPNALCLKLKINDIQVRQQTIPQWEVYNQYGKKLLYYRRARGHDEFLQYHQRSDKNSVQLAIAFPPPSTHPERHELLLSWAKENTDSISLQFIRFGKDQQRKQKILRALYYDIPKVSGPIVYKGLHNHIFEPPIFLTPMAPDAQFALALMLPEEFHSIDEETSALCITLAVLTPNEVEKHRNARVREALQSTGAHRIRIYKKNNFCYIENPIKAAELLGPGAQSLQPQYLETYELSIIKATHRLHYQLVKTIGNTSILTITPPPGVHPSKRAYTITWHEQEGTIAVKYQPGTEDEGYKAEAAHTLKRPPSLLCPAPKKPCLPEGEGSALKLLIQQ